MKLRRAEIAARIAAIARKQQMTVQQLLVDHSVLGLQRRFPHFSALRVLSRGQIVFFSMVLLIIALGLFKYPAWLVTIGGLVFTCFYLGSTGLRLAILPALKLARAPMNIELTSLLSDAQRCGTYSILVALYREGKQVRELVRALADLKWPEGQCEVLLVCEGDDEETLGELARLHLPDHFRIVQVPPCKPRTKPKALNYALAMAVGEFLVIYDAEDRPHPFQLLEARLAFEADELAEKGNRLACVQAPLLIHNHQASWLTRLFEVEYSTLFLGILPTLARWQVPLPLGGTSNHFRTTILKKVGGWDPFNVTEDADLGIRLFREQYLCSTITLPTREEAPRHLNNWLPQRTRWMKGWMQTILVHLRSPITCFRQLRLAGSLCFIFMLVAIVLSALVHPFFMVISMVYLPDIIFAPNSTAELVIGYVSLFNLVAGYLGYILLAIMMARKQKTHSSNWWLLLLPLYWLMISLAAWRALFQLFTNPHLWEKTDHVMGDTDQQANVPALGSKVQAQA